jgi:hypothetical protein
VIYQRFEKQIGGIETSLPARIKNVLKIETLRKIMTNIQFEILSLNQSKINNFRSFKTESKCQFIQLNKADWNEFCS